MNQVSASKHDGATFFLNKNLLGTWTAVPKLFFNIFGIRQSIFFRDNFIILFQGKKTTEMELVEISCVITATRINSCLKISMWCTLLIMMYCIYLHDSAPKEGKGCCQDLLRNLILQTFYNFLTLQLHFRN